MKEKLIGILVLALFSWGAIAAVEIKAPTIYGKVNKELRYVDQDKEHNYSKFSGVQEGSTGSRLGAKGNLDAENVQVGYVLEMGFDSERSTKDTTYDDEIYIRIAKATLDMGFGTFQVGQDWTVTGLVGIWLDPLNETGAGQLGAETSRDIKNSELAVGHNSRTLKDYIGYKTPKFAGWQLSIGYDRNDEQQKSADTGATNSTIPDNGHAPSTLEGLLSYDGDFGMLKPKLYLGYISTSGSASNDDTSMMVGTSLGMGDFTLTGMYSKEEKKIITTTSTDYEKTMIMGTGQYKLGAHSLALTYGHSSKEQGDKSSGDWKDQTQIALGYFYDINKYVRLSLVAASFKVKDKDDNGTKAKNDAKSVITGVRLNF